MEITSVKETKSPGKRITYYEFNVIEPGSSKTDFNVYDVTIRIRDKKIRKDLFVISSTIIDNKYQGLERELHTEETSEQDQNERLLDYLNSRPTSDFFKAIRPYFKNKE